MSDDSAFSCVLSFPDQSESFVLGFEAAPFWTRLRNGETLVKTDDGFPVHRANDELFRRMAEACGYDYTATPIDECWMNVRFAKVSRPRLAVVDGGKFA
jgi:hypothetical protein